MSRLDGGTALLTYKTPSGSRTSLSYTSRLWRGKPEGQASLANTSQAGCGTRASDLEIEGNHLIYQYLLH